MSPILHLTSQISLIRFQVGKNLVRKVMMTLNKIGPDAITTSFSYRSSDYLFSAFGVVGAFEGDKDLKK